MQVLEPSPRSALPWADRGAPGVDADLLARAAEDGAACAVWEPAPCLVVPASYRRYPNFEAECNASAAQGWPVRVRRSGGGLVPQGAGMLNLSLAWRTCAPMGEAMEPVYRALCELLQGVIHPFGVHTTLQAVSGSFCDGRYNLALQGRKVAGTAQYWQRISAHEHVVLAHACLLVEANLALLTARANAFEARLDSGRVYRLDALNKLVPDGGPAPRNPHGQTLNTATLLTLLGEAARQNAFLY